MIKRYLEDTVTGRRKSLFSSLIRIVLFPLSALYFLCSGMRNFLYNSGMIESDGLDKPVISVGNITAGGTGKTPVALLIAEHLINDGKQCALLARGYKSYTDNMNDELLMAVEKLPGLIVGPGSNRYEKGLETIEKGAEVILLDDGFQHRQLERDCDILTIDISTIPRPHLLLPSGPFREPWRNRNRADIVLITKTRSDDHRDLAASLGFNSNRVFCCRHKPDGVVKKGRKEPLSELEGSKAFIFCGIGDPDYFMSTVSDLNVQIKGKLFYPDHHAYSESDMDLIIEKARTCSAEKIITTEKDMIKTGKFLKNGKNNIEFLALSITIDMFDRKEEFFSLINKIIDFNRDNT